MAARAAFHTITEGAFFLSYVVPRARARRANKIIIIVRTQSVPRVVTKIYRPLFPTLALAFRQAESIRPFSEPWLCVPNAAPWLRSA